MRGELGSLSKKQRRQVKKSCPFVVRLHFNSSSEVLGEAERKPVIPQLFLSLLLPRTFMTELGEESWMSFFFWGTLWSIIYKFYIQSLKLTTKSSLKLNIKKTKIMASSPITSWQIEGEKVEVLTDFLFLGSKLTADGVCNHEIRRCLLFGRKVMTNLW